MCGMSGWARRRRLWISLLVACATAMLPPDTAYDGFFTHSVDLTRAVSAGARAPFAILARRYK